MVCRSALLVAQVYKTLPLKPAETGTDNVCIISDLQVFNSDFIIRYNKQAYYYIHYNKEFVPETHTYKGSTSQIM
jgi:hypothetical protein